MAIRRQVSGWGTVAVALAGLWAVPLAGNQLGLLTAVTALVVGAGAEEHARLHPRFGPVGLRRLDGFWIGPALTTLAAALLIGRLDPSIARAVPILGALLVGVVLLAQDKELDPQAGKRLLPLLFALVLFLVAFTMFVIIYSTRENVGLAALATGVAGAFIAVALFRPAGANRSRSWLLALLLGLCLAELSLALSSWIVTGLLGGAFMLLYFYVAAGLIQTLLEGTLTGRLAAEYGVVGLIGLILILSTTPWRA